MILTKTWKTKSSYYKACMVWAELACVHEVCLLLWSYTLWWPAHLWLPLFYCHVTPVSLCCAACCKPLHSMKITACVHIYNGYYVRPPDMSFSPVHYKPGSYFHQFLINQGMVLVQFIINQVSIFLDIIYFRVINLRCIIFFIKGLIWLSYVTILFGC